MKIFIYIVICLSNCLNLIAMENVPLMEDERFYCPISLALMDDPVSSNCEHVFNRTSIERWLTLNATCPICRTVIASVTERKDILKEIEDYKANRNELVNKLIKELEEVDTKNLDDFFPSLIELGQKFMLTLSEEEFADVLAKRLHKSNLSVLTFLDEYERTLLFYANLIPNPIFLRVILLAAGNDAQQLVLKQDTLGRTALHYVARDKDATYVRPLLHGAGDKINELAKILDYEGKSALHEVVFGAWCDCHFNELEKLLGKISVIRALLYISGINREELINIENRFGKSPMKMALESENEKLIRIISGEG